MFAFLAASLIPAEISVAEAAFSINRAIEFLFP